MTDEELARLSPLSAPALASMDDAELERIDPLVLNMIVARGIPELGAIELTKYVRLVDGWALAIAEGLAACERDDSLESPAHQVDPNMWRAGAMAVAVAGSHIGIGYTRDVRNDDHADLFVPGMIDTKLGTCSNMPVLYMAIGYRLHWPIRAVVSKDHMWCRWDDSVPGAADGGSYFNLESTSTTNTGDGFGGFDTFGRLSWQHWIDVSGTPSDITRFLYEYSPASDVVVRLDARVDGSGNPIPTGNKSDHYLYDGLHRLVEANRGVYNPQTGQYTTETTPGTEQWTLDTFGNWTTYGLDLAPGSGGFPDQQIIGSEVETRTFDANTNEFLGIDGTSDYERIYDPSGNLIVEYTGPDTRKILTYDPWNRLIDLSIQTKSGGDWSSPTLTPRAVYSYYALNQRAGSVVDNDADGAADTTNAFFYDAEWRLLEHRINDTSYNLNYFETDHYDALPSEFDETRQYVWGLTYIDELVYYQRDDDFDGDFDASDYGRYAIVDRSFSVLGYQYCGGSPITALDPTGTVAPVVVAGVAVTAVAAALAACARPQYDEAMDRYSGGLGLV